MLNKELLSRKIAVEDLEFRSVVDGDSKQEYVDGLGVVYDCEEQLWDGYYESVSREAFDKWLKRGEEIKCFFNHDANQVLSTTKSTPPLVLENTDKGLVFHSPIPPTEYGKSLIENLKRKNVRGASFTFIIPEGGDIVTRDEKGNIHRNIVEAEIYEIGPVTNAAYRSTKSYKRDMREMIKELSEALDKTQAVDSFAQDLAETRTVQDDVQDIQPATADNNKYSIITKQNENLLTLRKMQLHLKTRSIL